LKDVQRFAIFVMSDTLGSLIKECDPPKNVDTGSNGSTGEAGFAQEKAERIINRIKATKVSKCK
jgi:hypothetical protein